MTKRPSFMTQSIALMKRNILLKKRNWNQLICEIVIPLLLFLLILFSAKQSNELKEIESIPELIGTESPGSNWKSFKTYNITWVIVPENDFTKSVVNQIDETFRSMRNYLDVPHIVYETHENLSKYIEKEFYLAVVFDNNTEESISYTLKIPQISMAFPRNKTIGVISNCRKDNPFKSYTAEETCPEILYYLKGYTFAQTVIDSSIIRAISENSTDSIVPQADLLLYPKPSSKSSITGPILIISFCICFVFAQLLPLLTVNLVKEKQNRIKEAMYMMGLRATVYWFSWFTIEAIIILIISLVMSTYLWLSDVLRNTNFGIIFLLVFMVGLTFIELSAIISMIFDKELTATQVAPLFPFFVVFIPIGIIYLDLPVIVCYFLTLVSPIALALAIKSIFEITFINDSTLSLYNIFFGTDLPIGIILVMLAIDVILYALLAVYLDKVMPGKYGVKHNLCFCFNKRFWFPQTSPPIRTKSTEIQAEVEEVSKELEDKGVIVINKMSKKFKDSNTFAVNKISMTIYESEITALLGHNGAGKTTLINMLLGALSPTSGTAHIYGKDVTIPSEMSEIRSMFGVCLQENILFDELDSKEHLIFFGEMKGLKGKSLTDEVNQLLIDVDLYQNRFTHSKDLSGGQKRKLCIAIALISNPKVVILDEPTSGVDIASRQQIWKMIRSYKSDKTIIMTTHFMEEADVMSDRKAIISKGKLRCVGSSMFLKLKFGVGYHLVVDLNKDFEHKRIEEITQLVQKEITNSVFKAFIGSEVFYDLPQNQSQNFAKLFTKLDNRIETIKDIKSYGISMTTLEEVFLKLEDETIAEEESKKEFNSKNNKPKEDITKKPNEIKDISLDTIRCRPNFCQSFVAFLWIKICLQIRNPINFLSMIFGAIFLGVLVNVIQFSKRDYQGAPFLLSPNLYDKPLLNIQNKSNGSLSEFISIVNQFNVKTQLINDLNLQTLGNSYMSVVIDEFKRDAIKWKWIFNETHIYALPILQNLMANTYLQYKTGNTKQIKTSIHLIPGRSYLQIIESIILGVMIFYNIWLHIIVFSLALSIDIVDDRETKIMETIKISGMGFWCYWTVNLTLHMVLMIFYATLLTTVLGFTDIYIDSLILFYIHLIISIAALLLLFYVLGHLFASKASASIMLVPVMLISFVAVVVIFFSMVFEYYILSSALLIFGIILWPPFGSAFVLFLMNLKPVIENHWQIEIIDYLIYLGMVSMLVSIGFYLCLLKVADKMSSGDNILEALGLSSGVQQYLFAYDSPLEDEDVIQERSEVLKVIQTKQNTPILLVHGLRKVFFKRKCLGVLTSSEAPEVAVNSLSFMVRENNIFGLLGPNGAGKTTAIKVIIRQEKATNGLVLINGRAMESAYLHKHMGYCPQHDTFFKKITLKQHLRFFAAIRGFKGKDIDRVCDHFMNALRIKEHENKYSEHLSGGTKRKLCYILSLMGPSQLVLLDEPSTGMDPHSKRFLWNTIQSTFSVNSSKCAVLTTHSMEEANALCTRIAILTKGVMRCIGSAQHLKNKYGAGYQLYIKWNPNLTKSDPIKQMVSNIFKVWSLKEESEDRLMADIAQQSVGSLSKIFLSLENMKSNESNGIQDYSFSQTTLEQVFIYFAKEREIIAV